MENDDREKKEIKAEAQRCALSEKRKFWASTQQQRSTVKLFSSFALLLIFTIEFFPPRSRRNGRKATDKDDYAQALSRRESFSRVSFGLIAIIVIDLREAFEQLRKSRRLNHRQSLKLAQRVIEIIGKKA
jgi:hypothetical protein